MRKVSFNMSSIKKSLLVGVLVLTMWGLTGCSSKEEKSKNNENDVVQQETVTSTNSDFEKMSDEESKKLQAGDVVEKEPDRAVLEKNGLDYVYVYNGETEGVKLMPTAVHEYEGKTHISKTTKGEKTTFTFDRIEVVEIYYEKNNETNDLIKKMKFENVTIEAKPIYPELAKDKVK